MQTALHLQIYVFQKTLIAVQFSNNGQAAMLMAASCPDNTNSLEETDIF